MSDEIKVYDWWGNDNSPPENLKTPKQLSEMGLKPGEPVGVIHVRRKPRHGGDYDLYLYDPDNPESARPKRKISDRQRETLDRGRDRQKFLRAYRAWLDLWKRSIENYNRAVTIARDILENPDRWAIVDISIAEYVVLGGTGITKRVTEIAIVDPTGAILLDTPVKPTAPVTPEPARHGSGLSDKDLENAPGLPELYPLLCRAGTGRSLALYNALRLDSLAAELHRHGFLPEKIFSSGGRDISIAYEDVFFPDASVAWQNYRNGDNRAIGGCRATLEAIKELAAEPLIDPTEEYFRSGFYPPDPKKYIHRGPPQREWIETHHDEE